MIHLNKHQALMWLLSVCFYIPVCALNYTVLAVNHRIQTGNGCLHPEIIPQDSLAQNKSKMANSGTFSLKEDISCTFAGFISACCASSVTCLHALISLMFQKVFTIEAF